MVFIFSNCFIMAENYPDVTGKLSTKLNKDVEDDAVGWAMTHGLSENKILSVVSDTNETGEKECYRRWV